jgi:hypothetical protein
MRKPKQPSRVQRILRAQQRVTRALEHLVWVTPLDAAFPEVMNEYRAALDERAATEREVEP